MAGASALAFAESAVADERHAPLSPSAAEHVIGDRAEPAANGLYRVRAGGATLLTHGPDPAPPAERVATRGTDGVFGSNGSERPPVCASDYYQHVLVGHVAGYPDRLPQVKASVQAAIRRMNWVLNADAVESGGTTADYKVLCDERGEIRVDSFASPTAEFEDIVSSARAAGHVNPNADYTIFFDSASAAGGCGIGSYRSDERLAAGNASNSGGGYGITYQPCWFGTTPMHENAHNQGAVQYSSPQSTGTGGHCNQGHDVLCYAPDGGDRNQTHLNVACADRPHFDCGGDDYFDTAPEPGEYLDAHWNLGSPLNRFIAFGGGDQGDHQPSQAEACQSPACAMSLRLGASVGGVVRGQESMALYRLRVPRGKRSLEVEVNGIGPLALYVRRGGIPGAERADCRAADGGVRQVCRIARPRRGAWFVGVGEPQGVGETAFALHTSARSKRRSR